MKFKRADELKALPAISSPKQGLPGAGTGGDLLTRINEVIANFKELLETAKAAQGQGAPGQNVLIGNPNAPTKVQAFINYLIKEHGDTTIGEILGNFSPMTIKQFAEVLRNVGLIK